MKVLAISQRIVINKFGAKQDALEHNWLVFAEKLGFLLVPIPNIPGRTELLLNQLNVDGVVLSGGNNIVGTSNYQPEKSYQAEDSYIERDETEAEMIKWAIKRKVPMLGICRGAQFINVFFGGKLAQVHAMLHVAKTHRVAWVNQLLWQNEGKETLVNSFHNFGMYRDLLAPDLIAVANYGNEVEAFVHKNRLIAGVMWHPERYEEVTEIDRNIFVNLFRL